MAPIVLNRVSASEARDRQAAILEELNYEVTPPDGGHPERNDRVLRSI